MARPFQLGACVVEVHTRDGAVEIEDWHPAKAGEAEEYAEHTAYCTDVAKTVFRHRGREAEFVNPDAPSGA